MPGESSPQVLVQNAEYHYHDVNQGEEEHMINDDGVPVFVGTKGQGLGYFYCGRPGAYDKDSSSGSSILLECGHICNDGSVKQCISCASFNQAYYEGKVKEAVPSCMYVEDASFALSKEVGPAVPWMRRAALFMLATQVSIFVYLELTMQCPDEADEAPVYPNTIFLAIAPAVIFRFGAELFALKVFLGSYVRIVARSKVVGLRKPFFKLIGFDAPFYVWLLVSLVFSFMNSLDQSTDTLSAAVYSTLLQCPVGSEMERIWTFTYDQSIFGKIGVPRIHLRFSIIAMWLIAQLQVFIPIVYTIRKGECALDYSRGSSGTTDSCLTGVQLWHGAVWDEMAEANGSASLQTLSFNRYFCDIQRYLQMGNANNAANAAATTSSATMHRVFLSYCLENLLQANLQTTLFAMLFCITGKRLTKTVLRNLFSIVLSISMTFLKVGDARTVWMLSYEIVETEDDEVQRSHVKRFRRNMRMTLLAAIVLIIGCSYAAFKLIAAFYCNDSMFNLTGCVTLPGDVMHGGGGRPRTDM